MLQNGKETVDVGMSKRILDCLPTQGGHAGDLRGHHMSRSISPSASLAAGGDLFLQGVVASLQLLCVLQVA